MLRVVMSPGEPHYKFNAPDVNMWYANTIIAWFLINCNTLHESQWEKSQRFHIGSSGNGFKRKSNTMCPNKNPNAFWKASGCSVCIRFRELDSYLVFLISDQFSFCKYELQILIHATTNACKEFYLHQWCLLKCYILYMHIYTYTYKMKLYYYKIYLKILKYLIQTNVLIIMFMNIYKSTKMNKNSKYFHEKTKVQCCEIYKQYMDSIFIYIYIYISL